MKTPPPASLAHRILFRSLGRVPSVQELAEAEADIRAYLGTRYDAIEEELKKFAEGSKEPQRTAMEFAIAAVRAKRPKSEGGSEMDGSDLVDVTREALEWLLDFPGREGAGAADVAEKLKTVVEKLTGFKL